MYSFKFDSVTPAIEEVDSQNDLNVYANSMFGIPGSCDFYPEVAVSWEPAVGELVKTSGDDFAFTCGYYVEYEWNGQFDVFWKIKSNNAINLILVSGLSVLAVINF